MSGYGRISASGFWSDRDTGQPLGFGFVDMANDDEAERGIAGTNGTQLGARNINVNEARPAV